MEDLSAFVHVQVPCLNQDLRSCERLHITYKGNTEEIGWKLSTPVEGFFRFYKFVDEMVKTQL